MRATARVAAQTPSDAEVAIARTVIYASLFDYPLTVAEARESLIESEQTESEILTIWRCSTTLRATVAYEDGFLFPVGRRDLIAVRRRREQRSVAFLEQHRRFLELVCAMPYVRMVAISGSLAHLNLDEQGDLDLFLITRGRRAWSVTVAVILLAKLLRCRRTVCANFVISDTRLEVGDPDLFTANQILHLKPLCGSDVYAEFLAANPFVRRFYPNFQPNRRARFPFMVRGRFRVMKRLAELLLAWPSLAAEAICRSGYQSYLRRRSRSWQSPEQVRLEPESVKLHTHSHREPVLERFDLAMTEAVECSREL